MPYTQYIRYRSHLAYFTDPLTSYSHLLIAGEPLSDPDCPHVEHSAAQRQSVALRQAQTTVLQGVEGLGSLTGREYLADHAT